VVAFLSIDGDLVARADPVLMTTVFKDRVHGDSSRGSARTTDGRGRRPLWGRRLPRGSRAFGDFAGNRA
jgi:hypothetical protein